MDKKWCLILVFLVPLAHALECETYAEDCKQANLEAMLDITCDQPFDSYECIRYHGMDDVVRQVGTKTSETGREYHEYTIIMPSEFQPMGMRLLSNDSIAAVYADDEVKVVCHEPSPYVPSGGLLTDAVSFTIDTDYDTWQEKDDSIISAAKATLAKLVSEGFCLEPYPAHCSNSIKDASEVDIDCGGDCKRCAVFEKDGYGASAYDEGSHEEGYEGDYDQASLYEESEVEGPLDAAWNIMLEEFPGMELWSDEGSLDVGATDHEGGGMQIHLITRHSGMQEAIDAQSVEGFAECSQDVEVLDSVSWLETTCTYDDTGTDRTVIFICESDEFGVLEAQASGGADLRRIQERLLNSFRKHGFCSGDHVEELEVIEEDDSAGPAHCSNGEKDGDEEGKDCGGSCPVPCMIYMELDQENFFFNFSGGESLGLAGSIRKYVSTDYDEYDDATGEYVKPSVPVPGKEVRIKPVRGKEYFGSRTVTTDADGRFSVTFDIPAIETDWQWKEREVISGKPRKYIRLDASISQIHQEREYEDAHSVYIYKRTRPPRIVDFKKHKGPLDEGEWHDMSFSVDSDFPVESVTIITTGGRVEMMDLSGGSMENPFDLAMVQGTNYNDPVSFRWYAPEVGMEMNTHFLNTMKRAIFGGDEVINWKSETKLSKGLMAGAADKLNSMKADIAGSAGPTAKLGKIMEYESKYRNMENYQGIEDVMKSKNSQVRKNLNKVKWFSRSMNSYKVFQMVDKGSIVTEQNRKAINENAYILGTEDTGTVEGFLRGSRMALEGYGVVEGLFAIFEKNLVKMKGGKELSNIAHLGKALTIDAAKGLLDYTAGKMRESRAAERLKRVPIYIQATDTEGQSSKIERQVVYVRYMAPASEPVR